MQSFSQIAKNLTEKHVQSGSTVESNKYNTHQNLLTAKPIQLTGGNLEQSMNENVLKSNDLLKNVSKNLRTCKICNKRLSCNYLRKHIRIHSNQKPFECDYCGKIFSVKFELSTHIIRQHAMTRHNRPFECKICYKNFKLNHHLRDHMIIHTGVFVKCSVCNMNFTHKHKLNQHVLLHTKEKHFICDYCKKEFPLKYYLKKHILSAHAVRLFKCDLCHQSFAQIYHLKRHKMLHTTKVNSCDYCHKTFSSLDRMKHHKVKCARKRNNAGSSKDKKKQSSKIFKCKICEKIYKIENNLIKHVLKHDEDAIKKQSKSKLTNYICK